MSLSKGEFLTYVEVRQGKVCFLAHVPELRHYDAGARDALAKMAWAVAVQTVESRPDASRLQLAVGLRGTLLYGAVMLGTGRGTTPMATDDPTPLEAFFAGPLATVALEEKPSPSVHR